MKQCKKQAPRGRFAFPEALEFIMEDLCDKCAGWIRSSPTADTMDPSTWCTCSLVFKKDTTEEPLEEVL